MNIKLIENHCLHSNEKCVLMIDGEFFGYDSDPLYPEAKFKDREKAYVFNGTGEAFYTTTWISGKEYKILRV